MWDNMIIHWIFLVASMSSVYQFNIPSQTYIHTPCNPPFHIQICVMRGLLKAQRKQCNNSISLSIICESRRYIDSDRKSLWKYNVISWHEYTRWKGFLILGFRSYFFFTFNILSYSHIPQWNTKNIACFQSFIWNYCVIKILIWQFYPVRKPDTFIISQRKWWVSIVGGRGRVVTYLCEIVIYL